MKDADALPVAFIHVGDFGIYSWLLSKWVPLDAPTYVIDGNHEDHRYLASLRATEEMSEIQVVAGLSDVSEYINKPKPVVEIAPNLFHVPRGTVLELDGRVIGFCGGGESLDYKFRRRNVSWWEEERIVEQDIKPLYEKTLDYLITHTPPLSVIQRNFPPVQKEEWSLPREWKDQSAQMIDVLMMRVTVRKEIISGHMHKTVRDGQFRILDIDELYCI